MSSWSLAKTNNGWRLPLEDREINRCIIDYAFSLEFQEGRQTAVLRIEGDFTIDDHGHTYRLNPSVLTELGPAVALFGQVVRFARASVEGKLELTFINGRILSVDPDACYEAWEMTGPNGTRAVCLPGGTISVWQPKDA